MSSVDAEYRDVANVVSETCWLRNLLLELHFPMSMVAFVYCDNVSAVYLSGNPVHHQRTKHIEMDIHFVQEKYNVRIFVYFMIYFKYQFADILTKGLHQILFDDFRSTLVSANLPIRLRGCIRIEYL